MYMWLPLLLVPALQKLNFFGAPLLGPEQQARMELAELDAQVGSNRQHCFQSTCLLAYR
jgi:hypothetical protein